MRLMQLWSLILTTCFVPLGAIAISLNAPSQQIAQADENCRGQQILTASNCAGDGLEPEEAKLYQLVNQYRAQNGLPAIPLSKSLTLVANRHVRDLEENIGELTHSWSNCLYDSDNQNTWPCMWEAPQRLKTAYSGRGYENAYGVTRGYRASAASALRSWQGSSFHNEVILNQGIWQNKQWNSLGIGIYGGFAVLWFGQEPDSINTINNNSISNPVNNPTPQPIQPPPANNNNNPSRSNPPGMLW